MGWTATTFRITEKGFQNNEYPLAMFVYMHRIKDLVKDFEDWRNASVATVMERPQDILNQFGNGFETPQGLPIPLIPEEPDGLEKSIMQGGAQNPTQQAILEQTIEAHKQRINF